MGGENSRRENEKKNKKIARIKSAWHASAREPNLVRTNVQHEIGSFSEKAVSLLLRKARARLQPNTYVPPTRDRFAFLKSPPPSCAKQEHVYNPIRTYLQQEIPNKSPPPLAQNQSTSSTAAIVPQHATINDYYLVRFFLSKRLRTSIRGSDSSGGNRFPGNGSTKLALSSCKKHRTHAHVGSRSVTPHEQAFL